MGENGDENAESTTAGAASFDDFSIYFVRFLMLAIWVAYAMPLFEKLLDGKPWKLNSKIKKGWNYITGPKAIKKIQ